MLLLVRAGREVIFLWWARNAMLQESYHLNEAKTNVVLYGDIHVMQNIKYFIGLT